MQYVYVLGKTVQLIEKAQPRTNIERFLRKK